MKAACQFLLCVLLSAFVVSGEVHAADTWVEVRSPNVRVVSGAGEATARHIAQRIEEARAIVQFVSPIPLVELHRPLLVIAVKDSSTFRAIDNGQPTAVANRAAGDDRYYLLLDGSFDGNDNTTFRWYSSYISFVIDQNFGHRVPYWLEEGLCSMLADAEVSGRDVRFGVPRPRDLEILGGGSDLYSLPELLRGDNASVLRARRASQYDAQSWALVELLHAGSNAGSRLKDVIDRLLRGRPSEEVLRPYGTLAEIEDAYLKFVKRPASRWKLETGRFDRAIDPGTFQTRSLPPAEQALALAGFALARNLRADAAAQIEKAKKADAGSAAVAEMEGLLLMREGKTEQARALFTQAVSRQTTSFAPYFYLARTVPEPWDGAALTEVQQLLGKAIEINDRSALMCATLSTALLRNGETEGAIRLARRAVELDPYGATARLFLARALAAASKKDEALTVAREGLELTRSDTELQAFRTLIASLSKSGH